MRKQLFFSTGTIGIGLAVAALIAVVAFRYAVASDHCVIVDQSHRDDGNLQGSATS